MFCNHCGKEIAAGKKFCSYCGAQVIGSVGNNKVSETPVKATKEKSPKEKKKFRINKALIVSILEIGLIVVAVWGLLKVGKNIYGPASLAKVYMDAIAEDDWDRIMNLTNIEETDFVNKQTLKGAISETISGDFDTYDISLKNIRGRNASVEVEYGDGGRTNNDLTLIMVKQDEKALYVFDTWKVSAESYIVEDFAVYVPKGTDAVFDGIILKDEYRKDLSSFGEGEGEGFDSFVIPEICAGKHKSAAMVGDYVLASKEVDVSEEGPVEVRLSDVSPSEELQEEIINAAYADLETILDSKVKGNTFNSVKDLFIDDKDARESARNNYENSLNSYYEYNGESGIKKISVKEAEGIMEDFYLSNEGDISSQVNINYKYDTTKVVHDWWSNENKDEINKNNSGNFYVYMTYVDGDWKIKEAQLPYGL